MSKKKEILLGYCPKCGKDVEVDFCDDCQVYTQEPIRGKTFLDVVEEIDDVLSDAVELPRRKVLKES